MAASFDRIETRHLQHEPGQVVASSQRHAPATVPAVVSFPNRPRRQVATFAGQLLEPGITLAVGPRHQVNFSICDLLEYSSRFDQFPSRLIVRQEIKVTMPETVRPNRD